MERMTAEIIQFVPRPNPTRPTLIEDQEIKAAEFLRAATALAAGLAGDALLKPDFPFCDLRGYIDPDKDPA